MHVLFLIGSCVCPELHLWQIQGHSGWSWSHPTWETADVCQGLQERPKETEICRRQNGFGTGWAWVLWKVNYCSSYKSNCDTYYLQVDYSYKFWFSSLTVKTSIKALESWRIMTWHLTCSCVRNWWNMFQFWLPSFQGSGTYFIRSRCCLLCVWNLTSFKTGSFANN